MKRHAMIYIAVLVMLLAGCQSRTEGVPGAGSTRAAQSNEMRETDIRNAESIAAMEKLVNEMSKDEAVIKAVKDKSQRESNEAAQILEELYKQHSEKVSYIYLATYNEKFVIQPKVVFTEEELKDLKPTKMDWYKNAMKSGKTFIGERFDTELGERAVPISAPVFSDGKVIGVISVDLLLE